MGRGSDCMEGGRCMGAGQMRRKIVERSVQILREHGKSDGEIRVMMLKDFRISESALDEIMERSR